MISAIYSLIAIATLNDIDPQAWHASVLGRLAAHPAKLIHELSPGTGALRTLLTQLKSKQASSGPRGPNQGRRRNAYILGWAIAPASTPKQLRTLAWRLYWTPLREVTLTYVARVLISFWLPQSSISRALEYAQPERIRLI
jgi:hypothetical protein